MSTRRKIPQDVEEFTIGPDEAVYAIGVVSRLVDLPVWTLRALDREGVVRAKRSAGQTRLYSMHDLTRLLHIRRLLIEERVNLKGVQVIMRQADA